MNYYKEFPAKYYAVRRHDVLHVNRCCNIVNVLELETFCLNDQTSRIKFYECSKDEFTAALIDVLDKLNLDQHY